MAVAGAAEAREGRVVPVVAGGAELTRGPAVARGTLALLHSQVTWPPGHLDTKNIQRGGAHPQLPHVSLSSGPDMKYL